jgi:hypothetical protein
MRKWLSRLIATIFGTIENKLPYDTQSGFKVYKISKNLLRVFEDTKFHTRWFFDLEFYIALEKVSKAHIQVWEEPLESWEDKPGSKILTTRNLFTIPFEISWICFLLARNRVVRKLI